MTKVFTMRVCEQCEAEIKPHTKTGQKEWQTIRFCSFVCFNESRRGEPRSDSQRVIDDEKLCIDCGSMKSLSDFFKRKETASGYCSHCKVCHSAKYPRKSLDPEIAKGYYLIHRYGISLDVYQRMLEKQKGTCAICEKPERIIDSRTKELRELSVDHNHYSGKIRGLLCHDCNIAIGHLQDDPNLFRKAIIYLENDGTTT